MKTVFGYLNTDLYEERIAENNDTLIPNSFNLFF